MAFLAEGILKQHWDQTVPVNVAHIVKSMGVRLQLQDGLACSATLTVALNNQAHIALSRNLLNVYQRYVVAHALGHIALHHLRPGMQCDIHVGHDFRLDLSSKQRLEANDFALRLLMPEAAVRYAVEHMQAQDESELEHVFATPALLVRQRMVDLGLHLSTSRTTHQRPRFQQHQQPIEDV